MSERQYELTLYVWDGVHERAKIAGHVSAEDYQEILKLAAAAIERRIDEREQANDTD